MRDKDFTVSEQDSLAATLPYGYNKEYVGLERGNYVRVNGSEGNMFYCPFVVDNLYYTIVHGNRSRLYLYDLDGEPVTDAEVCVGRRRMSYDVKSLSFRLPRIGSYDEKMGEVTHDGGSHILDVG